MALCQLDKRTDNPAEKPAKKKKNEWDYLKLGSHLAMNRVPGFNFATRLRKVILPLNHLKGPPAKRSVYLPFAICPFTFAQCLHVNYVNICTHNWNVKLLSARTLWSHWRRIISVGYGKNYDKTKWKSIRRYQQQQQQKVTQSRQLNYNKQNSWLQLLPPYATKGQLAQRGQKTTYLCALSVSQSNAILHLTLPPLSDRVVEL